MNSVRFEDFELREVRAEDMDLLYMWANDSETRANSFNTDYIPYDVHKKWFEKTLKSDERIQLILEKSGTPIGQIRLDIEGGIGEVGYSIAKEQRGFGYGNVICNMMITYTETYLHLTKIIAQVKSGNDASKKCFLKNGFNSAFEQFEIIL